jgi:hypothetical protein
MGADSPKSALETEYHVPKDEHLNPITSCLVRDDLHTKAHLRSKGHLLTPSLKENILFTEENILTIEEQYNKQNNNIYAQTSLEVHSEGAARSSPFLRHGLVGGVPSGGDTSSFLQERGEAGVRMYQEDVRQDV